MATKQTKSQRIAELERKLQEALAGQASVYHFANEGLKKASTQHLMGSGVVLTLTVLGGRKICEPVLICDGLSDELIAALQADLVRSYKLATMYEPKVNTSAPVKPGPDQKGEVIGFHKGLPVYQ